MRRYGRFLETLEKLQDELGLLNDAVSTPGLLARVGLDRDPGAAFLITTIEEKAAMIEAAAIRVIKRMASPPLMPVLRDVQRSHPQEFQPEAEALSITSAFFCARSYFRRCT